MSSLPLDGKTYLVTGASMGIGEAVARELAEQGSNLILTARSQDKLHLLAKSLSDKGSRANYFPSDLSKPDEVIGLAEKILSTYSTLDGMVLNAGVGIYGSFEDLEEAEPRELFEINFFSNLTLIRKLLPLLKKGKEPRIVMVSTVISWRAIPLLSTYCASKGALNLFTEGLRIEVKKDGIGILNVYPGATRTAFSQAAKSTGWRPNWGASRGMPPEKVAKKLVKALQKGKRDEFISLGNRLLIWGNFFFPKWIDWGLGRYFKDKK